MKHFGEMGSRWGISRTVAQIYALLYISKDLISADEIAAALGCSRSNVSMGLRELESWRLLRLHHVPSDRREYFSTLDDIWEIFRVVADERRRREFDPTLATLRDLLREKPVDERDRWTHARLRDMHEVVDLLSVWGDEVRKLPTGRMVRLLKLGSKVARFLHLKDRWPAGMDGGRHVGVGARVMSYENEPQA